MKEVYSLIILGWICAFVFNLIPFFLRFRSHLLILFSSFFLFYCVPHLQIGLITVGWILLILFLFRLVENKSRYSGQLIMGYIFLIILFFLAFKLHVLETGELNSFLEKAMPIGFSFIAFQSIALLVDAKNQSGGMSVSNKSLISSLLFFPTFAAGPFRKYSDIDHQRPKRLCGWESYQGFTLFCLGSLKLGISAYLISPNILKPMPLNPALYEVHAIPTILLATVYLYANFSGYSDLVVGLSKMMGINVPFNFRFPFLAHSFPEYWRKWHITLGAWFKEYVFQPLSYRLAHTRFGEKMGFFATTVIATFITFFLIGLWHQINTKFLVYSAVNALLVSAFLFIKSKNWISLVATFVLTLLVNALFLSKSLEVYWELLQGIFNFRESPNVKRDIYLFIMGFVLLALFYFAEKITDKLSDDSNRNLKWLIINFIFSTISLFIGIIMQVNQAESVYVGY